MMTTGRDDLNKADAGTIAAIEAGVPALAEARRLAEDFHEVIRKQDPSRLDPWTTDAATSLIASFARGLGNDRLAFYAAITHLWLNGQTEGQVNR